MPTTKPAAGDGRATFAAAVDQMEPLLVVLEGAPRYPFLSHTDVPKVAGIYLFSENGVAIYVGQTRNLRNRLKQHTGERSTHFSASFAYLIAKGEAATAGMNIKRTRAHLSSDPDFAALFTATRARVRDMDVQFIEVNDPIVRTMFEMFVALVLDTVEYNSFETH
jgi:GIY-YIG catalytic domain